MGRDTCHHMAQSRSSNGNTTLAPDEAFAVLGNETRIRILQVLGETDGPLPFTELQDLVGIRQGAQAEYCRHRPLRESGIARERIGPDPSSTLPMTGTISLASNIDSTSRLARPRIQTSRGHRRQELFRTAEYKEHDQRGRFTTAAYFFNLLQPF